MNNKQKEDTATLEILQTIENKKDVKVYLFGLYNLKRLFPVGSQPRAKSPTLENTAQCLPKTAVVVRYQ